MQNYASLKNIIKYNTLFSLSIILFVAIAITNLVSANILSTQGVSVSFQETETINLEKENQVLLVKIEEASRLQDLEQVAKSQGFKRVSNIVFAPTASTVALR